MKKRVFKNIINTFYRKERFKIYVLFILSVFAGLFEYLGLALIFQFVLFLTNPNSAMCAKITDFFNMTLQIQDFQKISLILGLSVVGIYIFKNIFMLIFARYNSSVLEELSAKMTVKTVKNLIFDDYLTISQFGEAEKLNVISKITIVIWQYCYKYINLITNVIVALILISYLFIKFTVAAIVAGIFIGILSRAEYIYLKKQSDYQGKYFTEIFNKLNSKIYTIVNSIKIIKLNNNEEYFADQTEKYAQKYACLNKNRNFNTVFHVYFTEISVMLSFAIVLGVLFYTTNFDNSLLITSVSTICVVILRLTPVINRAQSCLYAINSYENSALEILDFSEKFNKNIVYSTSKEKLPFKKAITLKDVSFKYPKTKSGLKKINLEIKKGEFIGIVGESGCYKTTLALIISGIIGKFKGKLLIDGKEINDIKKWQNNVAFLPQDYGLIFEDVVKEISNNQKPDMKRIKMLLNKLNLKNINKDTRALSQGQKQRIALANILYQDREVVILDEATSSSDVVSEEKINETLLELKGKKTIISIAHRLQILKHCDKVIYMEKGEIVDFGSFKELEEKYEQFREIIRLSNFKSV